MKICRFQDRRIGLVEGEEVVDVTAALGDINVSWPFPAEDPFIARLGELRPRMAELAKTAPRLPLSQVQLQSPVANPPKIVAAPVNYRKHIEEVHADTEIHAGNTINPIERAGLFLKATTSLIGAGEAVRIRLPDRRNDHEIELGLVIGRRASNVSRAEALDHVAGYTIGLDMTIRGPEERSFRKSPDTYTVLGPWLVTADEFGDPSDVGFELQVNGETRQKANTRDLLMDVPALIEFASRFYTLMPGDVIITGTPEGVGPVEPGDVMTARIDRIGAMRVEVVA